VVQGGILMTVEGTVEAVEPPKAEVSKKRWSMVENLLPIRNSAPMTTAQYCPEAPVGVGSKYYPQQRKKKK